MTTKVSDVMTREVVTVHGLAPFKQVVRLMQEHCVSALPVVDEEGALLGIVSEGDLILKEDPGYEGRSRLFESRSRIADRAKAAGTAAWEIMTTPVVSIAPEASLAEAARTMHRNTIKRLPVLNADGRLVGIVSRADLLRVFMRKDAEIASQIRDDVIGRTLWMDLDSIRVVVCDGVVILEGQVERRDLVPIIERLVASVGGVVAIDNRLSSADHDRPSLGWSPLAGFLPKVGR